MASLRDEIGDFVGIPISFMEDTKQTAESRVVFMVLRYHTNKKSKRAFPGYETIMTESGLSRQKTAEGIKILVGTGWLVKHKKFAKVTEYELCYPGRSYSSTGELRQDVPIVPPANAVSSAREQPPSYPEQDQSTKINKDQPKPRRNVPLIDPPFHGEDFVNALAIFDTVQREKKKPLGVTRRKLVYDKLSTLSEPVATQALMEAAEAGWPTVYPKNNGRNGNNGNGHGKQSRVDVGLEANQRLREEAMREARNAD